jgi:uncharacterized protein YciI
MNEMRSGDRYDVTKIPSWNLYLNAEERQVMMDHGAYLRKYVEAGTVIVMGPVLEPAGPWGLAVFEAGSENEVRSITARDPTLLSGLGFRWEINPIAQAVVRNWCPQPHPGLGIPGGILRRRKTIGKG